MLTIRQLRAPVSAPTEPAVILRLVPKPHHAHKRWTPEQDAKLREMWEAGKTGSQVAAAIPGVSRSAAIARANRLGFRQPV